VAVLSLVAIWFSQERAAEEYKTVRERCFARSALEMCMALRMWVGRVLEIFQARQLARIADECWSRRCIACQ